MKAVICNEYGSPAVLTVQETEKPKPQPNEVLVKVHAASVTAADMMMRKGTPRYGRLFIGLLRPKVKTPGTGFAGVIEETGGDVTNFAPGDRVFGEVLFSSGSNAEYICVNKDALIAAIPEHMTCEEAAVLCDGALTSINFLQNLAQLQAGQSILINGASGSLGTAAIQLARNTGAHVTGVCSTGNMQLVRSLGADAVIDYTHEDFMQSGRQYDVIYDTVGKLSYSRCKKSLSESGVFVSPVLSLSLLGHVLCTALFGRKKARFSATGMMPVPALRGLLDEITGLLEKGKLRSVMDKYYALSEIREAHQYVETGHKVGNIALKI